MTNDRFDRSYSLSYADGYARARKNPPTDDTEINYRDGYQDGADKRRYDEQDETVDESRYVA